MALIDAAMKQVIAASHRVAGRPITYVRGSLQIPIASAVVARVDQGQADPTGGPRLNDTRRDYLIDAADLTLPSNTRLTPQRGDQILDASQGTPEAYEVQPVDEINGEVWAWSAPGQSQIRIHTVRVGVL